MKALTTLSLTLALAGSMPCAATALAQETRNGGFPFDLNEGVRLAAQDADAHTLRHYAGQKLLNTEGAELGTIKDFIVEPASGRVHYAVVSSGGVLGMGNSLRLVPAEALRRTDHKPLAVQILHAAFLQIPPIRDEAYVADQFAITPAQHQEMLRPYGGTRPVASRGAPASATTRDGVYPGLIRASTLRGKAVRTAERDVGQIENILLDLDRGVAAAVLDADATFTGLEAKYLVPLPRLAFTQPQQNPLTTTLRRADFESARTLTPGADNTRLTQAPRDERPLTPTGRSAAPATAPAGTAAGDDVLASTARSVRQALNADRTIAAEHIQVVAERGQVILIGTVPSQALKDAAERAARQVAPAGMLESRLTVQPR